MSSKTDFESPDYDDADTIKEDARIDAYEQAHDLQRRAGQQRALEQQALQLAVSSCLGSCLNSLDLLYIPREAKPISDVAVAHDSWRQEAEPEPCSRDSWLRGVIPEGPAQSRTPSTSSQAPASSSSKDRPLSGATARRGPGSIASITTADEAYVQRRVSTAASVSGGRTPSAGRTPTAAAVQSNRSLKDMARSSTGRGGASSSMSSTCTGHQQQQTASKQLSQEQQEAEDRLRQELQIRRQQEAIAKELKQKDEQARAALIAMQKELKGKDYTYDSSGKVVLLNKINPEQLPAPPGPQFKVHTAAAADAEAAAASGKHGSSKLSSSTQSLSSSSEPRTSRKSGAAAGGDFKPTASQTQPPVTETLKPAAGVTLRAGAAAKQGPKRDFSGQQTRTQYQQQAKAQNQQATRIVAARASAAAAPAAGSAAGSSTAGAAAGSLGASGRASPAPGSIQATTTSTGGTAAALAAAAAASGASGRALPALLPDQISFISSSGSPSKPASALQQPAAAAAAAAATRRPPSPDVNLVLVSAADWGTASGAGYIPPESVLVAGPSHKQIKEEFGRTTYLPKVRAAVATLKPPKSPPAAAHSRGKLSTSSKVKQ